MKKKVITFVACLMMILSFIPSTNVFAGETDDTDIAEQVSRSKTATELDSNNESTVTLSLPSAEEALASDIVFVMDDSQCGAATSEAAYKLVKQLLEQQELSNAKIKVGFVYFGGTAIVARELSEVTDAEELIEAIEDGAADGLHGSNIQSGLIEADKMLSEDTEVADSRKYVVLISDGHTYEFSKEGEYTDYVDGDAKFTGLKTYGIYSETDLYSYAYGISYTIHTMHDQYYTGDYDENGYKGAWEGYYLTDEQHSDRNWNTDYQMPYGNWDEYFAHISEVVAKDNGKYDVELTYTASGNYGNQLIGQNLSKNDRYAEADKILGEGNYIKSGLDADGNDNQLMHASGTDRAVYEAYTKFASMASKYHCYPIYVQNAEAYNTQDYGYQLMHAMGQISNDNGTDVEQHDITVTDLQGIFSTIKNDILYAVGAGSVVEDKMGADFDFVEGSFELTVGGVKLDSNTVGNVTYFGENASEENFRFKVEYDKDEDKFTWYINENVSNFAPVQLSYKVKLVNVKKEAGTYEVPTNEYAVLRVVDSEGQEREGLLEFPVPTVSYTVKAQPSTGDHVSLKLLVGVMAVSAVAAIIIVSKKKKLFN